MCGFYCFFNSIYEFVKMFKLFSMCFGLKMSFLVIKHRHYFFSHHNCWNIGKTTCRVEIIRWMICHQLKFYFLNIGPTCGSFLNRSGAVVFIFFKIVFFLIYIYINILSLWFLIFFVFSLFLNSDCLFCMYLIFK